MSILPTGLPSSVDNLARPNFFRYCQKALCQPGFPKQLLTNYLPVRRVPLFQPEFLCSCQFPCLAHLVQNSLSWRLS